MPSRIDTGTSPVRTTYFDYTADGFRVARRDPDTTRYYAGGLYQRLISNATGTTMEERFRIPSAGAIVAEIVRKDGEDKNFYFHADNLGTPQTITDDDGNATIQEYGPFGSIPSTAPVIDGIDVRVGFTGQQEDFDLGLTDMGGRVYDPLAGRFTTPDPIMQAPFGLTLGQNCYAYAFNDPINLTDPSGFSSTNDAGSASNVVGGLAPVEIGAGIVGGAYVATHGLRGALPGVGNIASTLWMNIGGAVPGGGTFTAPAPTGAPSGNPNHPNAMSGVGNASGGGSPLVRSPESYAAGPKSAGPEDAILCHPPSLFECDEGGAHLKRGLIPLPDGTSFVQVGQAIEAAASAAWRWFRPPPPPGAPAAVLEQISQGRSIQAG